MIVFDLVCGDGGHVFEAWFSSTEDYESQQTRGLVNCPICGAADVQKAVMAPRISTKGNRKESPQLPAKSRPVPMSNGGIPADAAKAMLKALAEAQTRILETSDYVGERFADEARAIHVGDKEHRAIHGQATPDQARALVDEGIEVSPLPFPVRPPGADN